jgi:hypothetical protein
VTPDVSLRVAMSYRVSVPTTARHIGLAQPPRPSSLAGWSTWPLHRGGDPVERATLLSCSSHSRSELVRRYPLPGFASAFLAVHLGSRPPLRAVATFPCGPVSGVRHHFAKMGPYDACQPSLTRPSRAILRSLADRPGLPFPAHPVSLICQPYFMPDRPWVPSLQRFLPARRRATLSGCAVLPAVSHLAVPRLRGFQLSAPRSLATAPALSNGRVLRRRRCSRRRRVAPLLVVFPLRG